MPVAEVQAPKDLSQSHYVHVIVNLRILVFQLVAFPATFL